MRKLLTGIMVLTAVAAGCGRAPEEASQTTMPPPDAFASERPPGTPTPISEARALTPGTEVVLQGRVMGVQNPFVAGRAVFVLGDEAIIAACSDHCSTPWDACCDPVEIRINGTVTIQLIDEDGKVLSQGLKGVNGLKELSRVTVTGKVAPTSYASAFIVNADILYVEPGNPTP